MDNFGIAGIIPFVAAMFFLIWQEDAVIPLIGGLVLGSIMLSRFNPVLGLFNTAGDLILGSLLVPKNIILLVMIGEVIILFSWLNRSGFIHQFISKIDKKIGSKDRLEQVILLSSLFIFIDRHLSCLLAGTFTKPLADRKSLSPLKHAYLLNTVSSSLSTLIPLTVLTPLTLTAMGTAFEGLGIEFSPFRALYLSLPYQFYNIFSIFIAATLLVLKRDTGLMKMYDPSNQLPSHTGSVRKHNTTRNSKRENGSSDVLSFGLSVNTKSKPDSRVAFYGVIGTLVVLFGGVSAGLLLNVKGTVIPVAQPILIYGIVFVNALFGAIVFTLLYVILSRTVRYTRWRTDRFNNASAVTVSLIYILLALSIETLARKLSIGTILMGGLVDKALPINFIPMIVFVLACVVSFLSGSSPFTIAALLPISMRVVSMNMTDPMLVDHLIFATIAAVLSGASFGDMNSPFSVNYIIVSAVTQSGIKPRFLSQIGYSLIAFGASIVFGYLLFTINLKPYVSISSGFLVIALLLMFLTKSIIKK